MGKGEWYLRLNPSADSKRYERMKDEFCVHKDWACRLVHTAKKTGIKYITLTTRHHDGFSLYDTCGLNDYDAPHSACGRDLIAEFVQACRAEGIVPFFYHTLLDWRERSYQDNFTVYTDYLINSIEILCRNYGKIGGFWFDGMWDKPNADWQEDRLYATIRKYQPEAMIINNTGLNALGQVGHPEIDSVTFERGKPAFVDCSDKPRAGEMCQVLNDHWGYVKDDCNYKSVRELIGDLIDCRKYSCNFLLNTGLKGNGLVNPTDRCLLREVGKWIKVNKNFIYTVTPAFEQAENADMFTDGKYLYAVVRDVGMRADENVAQRGAEKTVNIGAKIKKAIWLDNGEAIEHMDNAFVAKSFSYGTSLCSRVAKIEID